MTSLSLGSRLARVSSPSTWSTACCSPRSTGRIEQSRVLRQWRSTPAWRSQKLGVEEPAAEGGEHVERAHLRRRAGERVAAGLARACSSRARPGAGCA